MERRKELADAAEEMQKELFASRIRELETEYRKPERREEVCKVFAGLFRLRERQGNGRAGCLGICYRYGSIRMGTYGLRLVLYGEDFCLDRNPTVCEWKPPCFFEMFEEDMAVILRKLKSAFPRIYAYEEDAVRLRCVEYYLAAVCRLCMDMEGEILCTEEFRRVERMDGFYVFFGRYRGGRGNPVPGRKGCTGAGRPGIRQGSAPAGQGMRCGTGNKNRNKNRSKYKSGILCTDIPGRELCPQAGELVRETGCKKNEQKGLRGTAQTCPFGCKGRGRCSVSGYTDGSGSDGIVGSQTGDKEI